MYWENVINSVITWLATSGLRVLICLAIIFISFPLLNRLGNAVKNHCESKNIDKTIVKSLTNVVKIGTKILVICAVLGYFGVDTASISALIATLGVGIGLAVQGSLANFAGGVLIILTRPFKVDDFIEAQGYAGTVEDINIIYTTITTVDAKVIYIPNGALANGNIVNYSAKDNRRVDLVFSISYSDDFEKAKSVITDLCSEHPLILKDCDIFCRMSSHSSSSIDITLRVWTKKEDYWTVHFDLLESVKAEFDKQGISIPFNQLDVHISNN